MAMNGIDISGWQQGIDLTKVPADFVICKATEGTYFTSSDCVRQVQQCIDMGRLFGTYHYIAGGNANAEIDFYIDSIKNWVGKGLICLDWEQGGNSAWGNYPYLEACVKRVIERTGIPPVIYAQSSIYSAVAQVANRNNCGLWIAQYPDMNPTGYLSTPWNEGAYSCVIRQYTSTGYLDGWAGALDLNKAYIDRGQWLAYAHADGVPSAKPAPVPTTPSKPSATISGVTSTYTVRSGDTLSGIAAKYGTTYQHLAQINGIADPNVIFPGQTLRIDTSAPAPNQPTTSTGTYTVQPGDTLSGIAAKYGTTWQAIQSLNGLANPNLIFPGQVLKVKGAASAPAPKPAASAARTYTVKSGDILSGIAAKYGTTYQHLAQINGIADPNLIYPGQVLRID